MSQVHILSHWECQQDLDAHLRTDHIKEFMERSQPFVDSFEIKTFKAMEPT